MNIVIAGGGRVGFHAARLLSVDGHDVTVIESDPNKLEQIDYALDVSTVLGNAASAMLLQDIGVNRAQLFVAATGSDQTNLIAAAAAKGLGAKEVMARVRNVLFLESSILYESILGIDYILSPDALAALEIANYIETPGTVASQDFGRGLVQMRQMRVVKSPTIDGRTLKDVCPPGSGVLLGVISRGDQILIPHGDTIVEPGDVVTLVGRRDEMGAVQKLFKGAEPEPQSVVIMGGGDMGLHLAQALENRQRSVKLFDHNLNRCKKLAALLKKTKVVCRDVTSRTTLDQEHVERADVFVATTRDDERNIVASVLAKEVGASQTIAVVHQPDFAPLVQKLGIDHAVTPRASLAARILKLVRKEKVSSMAILEEGQVEILEFVVNGDTPIVGKRLKEVRAKFPQQSLVATIQRGNEVIVPSGEDQIQAGDSVVLIAQAEAVDAAQKLFLR